MSTFGHNVTLHVHVFPHRVPDAARPRASLLVGLQSVPCMSSERVALCAGCGRKISDRYYLLAVDKQWHMRCLKCCECKLNLESELTCFSKDGSIYCKEDYYRYACTYDPTGCFQIMPTQNDVNTKRILHLSIKTALM